MLQDTKDNKKGVVYMLGFIASLVVAISLSLYIAFTVYVVSITSTVSWALANVMFVVLLTVAIDVLRQISGGKNN